MEQIPTKIKVLITDDHPVVREGLSAMLEKEADIQVVGEAENGSEAIDKASKLAPDIVLMDLRMPEIDGVTGLVTAVTANTITTNINSAAFTAFAYPTSAVAAAGVTHPTVTAVGEVATKLTSSLTNGAYYGMYLDTGVVGANTNVMDWMAFSRDYTV